MAAVSNDEGRPEWVSHDLYPFASHYFPAAAGRLHYVDEGRGAPLVFVHGNPSWSFEYRHLIAALRDQHRCIAPDHLGFGLSARSRNPADYHPAAHAKNFAALMDHLRLEQVTLVVSDWGGPIALDFARRHPERIGGLVISHSAATSWKPGRPSSRIAACRSSPTAVICSRKRPRKRSRSRSGHSSERIVSAGVDGNSQSRGGVPPRDSLFAGAGRPGASNGGGRRAPETGRRTGSWESRVAAPW